MDILNLKRIFINVSCMFCSVSLVGVLWKIGPCSLQVILRAQGIFLKEEPYMERICVLPIADLLLTLETQDQHNL